MTLSAAEIDGPRLLARLSELAAVSEPSRGVTRLAYGKEDVEARQLVARWMTEAQLLVEEDPATNIIGVSDRSPGRVFIGMGSHLDTVVDGGRFDGAYGVVAAIEVAAALASSVTVSSRGLAVVAFSNEEGARGSQPMVGSCVFAGAFDAGHLDDLDDDGVTLRERLRESGGHPDAIDASVRTAPEGLSGFLELHIEQGPVLVDRDIDVGIVDAVTGRHTVEVMIEGQVRHAGTTPMDRRQDALIAAARIVLAVEELATSGKIRVATCGHLSVSPNVRNVVPGFAVLGIDLRDVEETAIAAAEEELVEVTKAVARTTSTSITVSVRSSMLPTRTDERLTSALESAAAECGAKSLRMPSGAGHDAQVMALMVPTAMLFVPSVGGVSHAPNEFTSNEDLVRGAEVLLACVTQLLDRAPT